MGRRQAVATAVVALGVALGVLGGAGAARAQDIGRLHAACDDGNLHACVRFGVQIGEHRERRAEYARAYGGYVPRDPERFEGEEHAARLHRACERGDRHDCVRFGIIMGEHHELHREWRRSHPDFFAYER